MPFYLFAVRGSTRPCLNQKEVADNGAKPENGQVARFQPGSVIEAPEGAFAHLPERMQPKEYKTEDGAAKGAEALLAELAKKKKK